MGGVLGFVPLILFMFLGISLLEDSGYLARMAFMLDRIFRIFGLHGASVMAFIVSGGIAGRMGTAMESVTRYAGFDWQTNIALVGGFAAKEVVVSTLGTAYSLGEVDPEDSMSLAQRLRTADGWGPITAFSLILFTIFYSPCFVAVVCIVRESGSWKWGVFSMVFNTLLALSLSIAFYQTATWIMS